MVFDIFLFCQPLLCPTQVAVVEGEIIITTTGNLDTGHNQGMIFSSGQAGQLQLICKPCPQSLRPVRILALRGFQSASNYPKVCIWELEECGMLWYQIYWQDRQGRSIIIFQIQHISSDSCYSIKHQEFASAFDYWGGTLARTTQSHQKTFRLQT